MLNVVCGDLDRGVVAGDVGGGDDPAGFIAAMQHNSWNLWKQCNQVTDVKVPSWPHVPQIQQRIIQLGKNLVDSSSMSGAAELAWINDCKVKSLDELADCGGARYEKLGKGGVVMDPYGVHSYSPSCRLY